MGPIQQIIQQLQAGRFVNQGDLLLQGIINARGGKGIEPDQARLYITDNRSASTQEDRYQLLRDMVQAAEGTEIQPPLIFRSGQTFHRGIPKSP